MKNTLPDLNNHLFAQLERLSDEDLKGEELQSELLRAKGITDVSKTIVDNAKLVLDARKFIDDSFEHNPKIPRMLTGDEEK